MRKEEVMAGKNRVFYRKDPGIVRFPEDGWKYFPQATIPRGGGKHECTSLHPVPGVKLPVPRVIREVNVGGT
jgi:hypothetical protein